MSWKSAAAQHLCLPGSGKHSGSHHSYKMSSGASSSGERLTLIHKQLPLSLCRCRFRTAVPPNISLPFLANSLKKQAACLPFQRKKKETIKASQQKKEEAKEHKSGSSNNKKIMQHSAFYVNEIAGRHTNVSVNGCKAFLSLQGNPLGWHGLIQWGAGWMTHSGRLAE